MSALPIPMPVDPPPCAAAVLRAQHPCRSAEHRAQSLWNVGILGARRASVPRRAFAARAHRSVFEGRLDLLRRFRAGDRDALDCVYQLCREDVLRLVRHGFLIKGSTSLWVPGLGDAALAEDTVQEVFAKAFTDRARRSYDGVRPYRPYLLQIARNIRIDQERRRWREVALEDASHRASEDSADTLLCSGPYRSAEETLDWERRRRAAWRFVASLDAESQQFFRLRYLEELSQNDVAKRMVVTRRRARTLESRMVSGLKRQLQLQRLD